MHTPTSVKTSETPESVTPLHGFKNSRPELICGRIKMECGPSVASRLGPRRPSRHPPHNLRTLISCCIAHPTASHYNAGTWQPSTPPAFAVSDKPVGLPRPALALTPLPRQRSGRETTPCALPRCSGASKCIYVHASVCALPLTTPPPAQIFPAVALARDSARQPRFLVPKHQHPRRSEACPS